MASDGEAAKVAAAVLAPILPARGPQTGPGGHQLRLRDPQARLDEAINLAQAIQLDVRISGVIPVLQPRPATLFGSGKVEELKGLMRSNDIEVVVVDHALTPVQQRNLERSWGTKVIDRTGLILEIFGQRAVTREGRLQVELAHLTYQKSRLVRSWTHLERQRGGFGFLGGPGETQIEADRRLIQERITAIRAELDQVKRTRALHRKSRERVPYPTVALVGYTNAGKSSLFNRLTGAEVHAEDQLFATLDPTIRALHLPGGTKAVLSDTVGFISDLPTTLVAAFRATLEEVTQANLIVHVRDIASPDSANQKTDVLAVLAELGIAPESEPGRMLEVWNKSDLLTPTAKREALNQAARQPGQPVLVSAWNGDGVGRLLTEIENRLNRGRERLHITLGPEEGALANWIYENCEVTDRSNLAEGMIDLGIRIAPDKRHKLARLAGAERLLPAAE